MNAVLPHIEKARPAGVVDSAGRWTAVVLAGQRPGTDPLAEAFGTWAKALVRIQGEAMLSRVVRTLLDVPEIGRILVLAQETERLREDGDVGWMTDHPRVRFHTSLDGISTSLIAVTRSGEARWPLLVTTADHPLLTPETVRAFLARSHGGITAGVVERKVLLARYPESRRTWLRFRGGAYTGANLFALSGARAEPLLELWSSIEQDRKKAWRIAARCGPWLLLRALTRTISLEQAMAKVARRLGSEARPVVLDDPEAGIDVDKADDHVLAEAILAAKDRPTQ